MTSFDFRIKCYLPKTQGIALPAGGAKITFPDSEKVVKLNLPLSATSEDRKWLIVNGQGFSSKAQAEKIGKRAKQALNLCGVSLQIGLDVGRDTPPSGHAGFQAPGHNDTSRSSYNPLDASYLLPDDVHGLAVFPTRPNTLFVSSKVGRTRPSHPMPLERFVSELQGHYERNPEVTAKQELALELYSASYYEASEKTRFLTLITVVEVLAEQTKQNRQIQELIRNFLERTDEVDLEDKQRSDFKSGLNNLKRQSISSACRALTEQYLGPDGKKIFHAYYSVRSDLVHGGESKRVASFNQIAYTLDDMVSRLLLRTIYKQQHLFPLNGGNIPGLKEKVTAKK